MTKTKFKVGDKVVVRKTGERGTIVDPRTRKPSVRLENGEIVFKGSKGSKGLRHLRARTGIAISNKSGTLTKYCWDSDAVEALENAEQVKSWSKYDVEETPSSLALVFAGLFLGVVVTMVIVTPSIIQACN